MELFGLQVAGFLWGKLPAILLGAAGGFLYYRFVGCKTGGCPLTGNPWISMLYGAVIGFLTVSQ